jgi:spore coat protein CotF
VPPEHDERNTTAKIYALAKVPEFQAAVENANIREQVVYSARENRPKRTRKSGDDSETKQVDPETALKAWYQIRSNITHRGKSAKSDNSKVLTATEDLFNVTYLYLSSVIPSIEREWIRRKLGLLPQN